MSEAENLMLLILSVSNFIFNRSLEYQKRIYPANLSSEYGYIISYLCDNEGVNIFQRDIEREFGLGRSTVSTVLKRLESEGLIERKSVMNDARLKKVVPTEAAKMINEACGRELETFAKKLVSGINPKDIEIFSHILSIIKTKAENMKIEDDKNRPSRKGAAL